MMQSKRHAHWMDEALALAVRAKDCGDIPVGAVMVYDGQLLAGAFNTREAQHDPLGHAELTVLKEASQSLGRWRLTGCTLYVTLEPCPMCAAALVQARIDRVVFGAMDPKVGACGTVWNLMHEPRFNHVVEVIAGVEEQRCQTLLSSFFEAQRQSRRYEAEK
jgi:tRNA(adenine34) deaminase